MYLGKEGTATTKHCAALMQALPDAWFDYTADAAQVTPEWLAKFDAVLLDAPKEGFPSLAGAPPGRLVAAEFTGEEREWTDAGFINTLRERLLAAAGDARRKEWQTFVAQREPEKREPNPDIANYEKRPQPITFQEPMSVKASMQRTQVPIDMRLELFAAEPDIMSRSRSRGTK